MNNEKTKGKIIQNPGKTIKRLLSYIKGNHKILIVVVLLCVLLSSLTSVMGSMFIKTLIDDNITPMLGQSTPDFQPLLKAIFRMAIIYLVGIIATFIFTYGVAIISQKVLMIIRNDMFAHMQTLPIDYFDTREHGDIMSLYTNDTDNLREFLAQGITQVFSSITIIVAVLIAMFVTNLYLSLVVALYSVFLIYILKTIGGKSAHGFINRQKTLASVNSYVEEMLSGQKVIKVFNHEEKVKEEFAVMNEELFGHAFYANTNANRMMPIMMNLGNLLYVIIAIFGGTLAILGVGGLTLGLIASFLQLSRTFSGPLGRVSMQINSAAMALAGAERIFSFLDEKPEEDNGTVTLVNVEEHGDKLKESTDYTGIWAWKSIKENGEPSLTRLCGDIRFYDVDFSYVPEKPVLHDISLYAKPGQKIAFVGATGAGKTTITNLINRFYDIQDGEILYDGINIKDIKKKDLRSSLGIVLQDTNLFSGTIMDNIKYGKPDATDEEACHAAKLSHADSFICRLPNSYETEITDNGADLSQGQKQLLSIARAAIANPPVMILDEATSSIDTHTEELVQKGMDGLMEGRTVFVIAHRLSTIRNAKSIMVLDNGKIVERGDHEDLLAEKGIYYQLYTGMFELE